MKRPVLYIHYRLESAVLLLILRLLLILVASQPSCATATGGGGGGGNIPTGPSTAPFWGFNLRAATSTAARTYMEEASQRSGLLKAIPALQSVRRRQQQQQQQQQSSDVDDNPLHVARQAVSVKTKAIQQQLSKFATPTPDKTGFYYGMTPKMVRKYTTGNTPTTTMHNKPLAMKDAVTMTLDELRSMRQEMQSLRDEIRALKRNMLGEEGEEATGDSSEALLAQKRKRQREFDRIGREVERWAEHLLYEQNGEEDGWKEIICNKVLQSSLNPDGRTRAFLKWMKDSRGSHADPDDDREYPCLKVFSTIDAPLEVVCQYLSDEHKLTEYNDLMMKHKDLEEIAPHAKITWGQTPAILFIQPRELITFCHHRWLRDGTQVLVNQACNSHEGFTPGNPQAYALRGANFVSRHPDDPEKTRIAILAHANPGPDIPHWASKTAVKAMVPIEPFKLFYKINKGVAEHRQELEQALPDKTEMVSDQRRSTRPAGIAQMGYAVFWPNGGGLQEVGGFKNDSSSMPSSPSPSSSSSSSSIGMDSDNRDDSELRLRESSEEQPNGSM